jgi:SH3-like domain-containing protein
MKRVAAADGRGWRAWAAAAALLLAWGAAGDGAAAAERMRVTGNRVNLRSLPGFENSEVVGQADYGEMVNAVEKGDEWVGVEPPARVSYWVNKLYVVQPGNVVGANRLNVRAGPSLNYNVVATLERGTPVKVKEEMGDWLRIGAPAGTLVWIYRDFVESAEEPPAAAPAAADAAVAAAPVAPPEKAQDGRSAEVGPIDLRVSAPVAEAPAGSGLAVEPMGATTNAAAVAQPPKRRKSTPRTEASAPLESTPVAVPEVAVGKKPRASKKSGDAAAAAAASGAGRDLPTPIVAPSRPEGKGGDGLPASFKLIPLEGQGRAATYEGVLRAAPLFNDAPARYRVLRWQDNRWQLLCHVYGEASKFRALQDKSVRVSGKEYWIQNTAAPVLIPDRIQEIKLTEDVR